MSTVSSLTNAASADHAVCKLRPVDLHDATEYGQLQLQRRQCGWYYEDEYLRHWLAAGDAGTKCLFWITMPTDAAKNNSTAVLAGHISLDSVPEIEDPKHELANPNKTLLTISTFFVLPEHQGKGLGREAMRQVGLLARKESYGNPACSAIAIMSLSCRYVEDPLWTARYIEWTDEQPVSYERWYESMGYVKWKDEACTRIIAQDGEPHMLVEAFMKKVFSDADP